MLGKLIQLGTSYATKSQMLSKHVCFIVKGKRILSVQVNTHSNDFESLHAEERALDPKYRKDR